MTTVGEALIRLLEGYGVDTVFGIPGVHTVELYRGLAESPIRHVTPRHEQGAGFMADGYARASGKPGVAFTITGPGVTNIATAMGQAYGDSIPMLVVSSVNARATLGRGSGQLHELPSQRAVAAGVSAFSHTLLTPDALPEVLARAFTLFASARPRPVHLEIPTDVFSLPADGLDLTPRPLPGPPGPNAREIGRAVELIANSRSTVLLVGGGAVGAAVEVRALAERLDAATMLTTNARGILPPDHPLLASGLQSVAEGRQMIADADVVIAVGTELGVTDYDFSFNDKLAFRQPLIRIDIDPMQVAGEHRAEVGIVSDAGLALSALMETLGEGRPANGAASRIAAAVDAAEGRWTDAQRTMSAALDTMRDALGDPIIVGDSTKPIYQGYFGYRASGPRGWFNSSTGYGTLGYALPAAIGAKLSAGDRPVVALAGDGGAQFTLSELATAAQDRIPIIAVMWNNNGYREIRDAMESAQVKPIGVDVTPPDFLKTADAVGVRACRAASLGDLAQVLRDHGGRDAPLLVEIGPDLAS